MFQLEIKLITTIVIGLNTVLVFLNTNRNNPQAHESTVVALHPEVFRVSYFPQGMEVLF
jgi:hypothetical protein